MKNHPLLFERAVTTCGKPYPLLSEVAVTTYGNPSMLNKCALRAQEKLHPLMLEREQ